MGSGFAKAWLQQHWVAGAAFMGCTLLALVPLGLFGGSRPVLLVFLASPLYMLHQVEEHAGDRFRAFVNDKVFGGLPALGVGDVLWINLPGVWGINFIALYAAVFIAPGWGLAAAYLIFVNGLAHVAMAARLRVYNPGLVTGTVLFLPFGLAVIATVPASPLQHGVALVVALAVHGAIIAKVRWNVAKARRSLPA